MRKNNNRKGFTMVELLVSMFIFSLIMGGIVNTLFMSVSLQQRVIEDQRKISEVSFLLEYMSRTLRMARKDIAGQCITINHNYHKPDPNTIRFLNFDGECQEFSLINNSVNERIANSGNSADLPVFTPITSQNISITRMELGDAGSAWHPLSTNNNQSRVVILLEVKPRGADYSTRFQTVISQRKLNLPH